MVIAAIGMLKYFQQIYIAQNFILLIHEFVKKKGDSSISPWTYKINEVKNFLNQVIFPKKLCLNDKAKFVSELKLIQKWLDSYVKKTSWIHGAGFKSLKIEKDIFFLRFKGSCFQCPYLKLTIYKRILELLTLQFPQIQKVQLTYELHSIN